MVRRWRFFSTTLILLGLAACGPNHLDLDSVRPAPQLLAGHFATVDGLSLPYWSWKPDGTPRAVIVALHGFNDYSNFFDAPGRFFAANGIASYAYDQRGFGAGPFRGRWFDSDRYIEDAAAFSRAIGRRNPGVPLYVLGASMGGAVAMTLAASPAPTWVSGVILSAPAVWGRQTMPWYQTTLLDATATLWPSLRLTGRGLNITPSDNREMLLALGRDPLVIKGARVGTIHGLVTLMGQAFDNAASIEVPMLLLYGGKDEIIRNDPTQRMMASLPTGAAPDRKVITYPDGYHMLLRDQNGPNVWRDIIAWVDRQKRADAPEG